MYRKFILILVFPFIILSISNSHSKVNQIFFNANDFGIKNDGITKNTEAIKNAIEHIASAGGGTLYFPAGIYLTGPIHLKSNITILLESGSTLKFSTDIDDYLPMVPARWEGTEVFNFSPQIYAYNAENIAIRGRGAIDGQGGPWWSFRREYQRNPTDEQKNGNENWQTEFLEKNKNEVFWEFWDKKRGDMPVPFLRPPMIQPVDCKNVLIEGISIKDPPFWTINPVYCENVTITGITIKNPEHSPNTDGINPESCRYVHISNCHISVGDDCITIKSGRDADGRRVARPCENITITNCTMLDGHGGVVIGSEMSGDVRKVTISNCVFDGTDRGIRLKTMRGRGGIVEEIRVDNIVMKNIALEAIKLNMFYHPTPEEPVSERTPRFRNIHLSDITITQSEQAGFILGLPEMPVENVTFSNINIQSKKGFTIKDAKNIEFHNVDIDAQGGPSFSAKDASFIEFSGVSGGMKEKDGPVISLTDVTNIYIHDCFPQNKSEPFVKIDGGRSSNIVIIDNNFSFIKSPVKKGKNVSNLIFTE